MAVKIIPMFAREEYEDSVESDNNQNIYGFSYELGQVRAVKEIARKAWEIRNFYWGMVEYGIQNKRPLMLANENFQRIKDWENVSKMFNHLNRHYRTVSVRAYREFRKYNAAVMDLLNKEASQEARYAIGVAA